MTMDMSRYLGLFISEATEHLEALGRDLVQLEREGSSSSVDSMFRHAHSVKGMASSMGFEPIAIVAHRVEDLVDAVRQDRGRLDRDLVDLLLSASDTLLAQVRAVAEGRPPDDAAALLAQLGVRVTAMTGHAPTATRVAKVTVNKPEDPDGGGDSGSGSSGSGGAAPASGTSGSGGAAPASGSSGNGGAAPVSDAGTDASGDGGTGSGGGTPAGTSGPSAPVTDSSPGGVPGGGAPSGNGSQAAGLLDAPPRLTVTESGAGGVREVLGIGAPPSSGNGHVSPVTPPVLTEAQVADLGLALKAASGGVLPGEPAAEGRATQRWAVRLRISPTCQVPGVRAFLVHKRLTNLGTLVDLRPALEELKAGRIPDGYIQLEIETSVGEAGIQASLKNVAEVDVVSVKPAVAVVLPVVVPATAAEGGRAAGDSSSRTVRVRTELLDYFLDTVGELMLATARLREVGKVL